MTNFSKNEQWFYEKNGQRFGGVSENELINLIQTGTVSYGHAVWQEGMPSWVKLEQSELKQHLQAIPPPLTGDRINNTVIWILAFAPIIGELVQWLIAFAVNDGSEHLAFHDMAAAKYWYVTLTLNIALSVLDEWQLKKAGHKTNGFRGWVWLIPVYLFQRAKRLEQGKGYFITWLVCFTLILFDLL